MIVLPNTPPTPRPGASLALPRLSPNTLLLRSLGSTPGPAQAILALQRYVDAMFSDLAGADLQSMALTAALASVEVEHVPWIGVLSKKHRLGSKPVIWSVSCEISVALVAVALLYVQLGAALVNSAIESHPADKSASSNHQWLQIGEHYRSALAYCRCAAEFGALLEASSPVHLNPALYALIDRVCQIGIQTATLCKFSAANRVSFAENETLVSSSNGVLCRVAIWVMNEVKSCQNIVAEFDSSPANSNRLDLDYSRWLQYLSVYHKYASAYAGLFLAIEHYHKNELGLAIGLLNFSLVSLQSKDLGNKKTFSRLRSKLKGKLGDAYIANLQSVTLLNIDKSVFLDLSGAILNDLTFLFDLLVLLRVKFTKENDNLKFDAVVDWRDILSDLKWPLGAKIPVSEVKPFVPNALRITKEDIAPTRQYY